jgi:hypothetical protein
MAACLHAWNESLNRPLRTLSLVDYGRELSGLIYRARFAEVEEAFAFRLVNVMWLMFT